MPNTINVVRGRGRSLFGPDMIKEAEEQVAKVRKNLKAAQSRQKSYVDTRLRPLEFQPRDFDYLKVSPIRGTQIFQVREKLAPWYIASYRIIEKIRAVAYRLELPPKMSDIHDVFHVSQLNKCLRVPEEQAPMVSHRFATRFIVLGKTNQDIGYCHPTSQEDRSKILLGTME